MTIQTNTQTTETTENTHDAKDAEVVKAARPELSTQALLVCTPDGIAVAPVADGKRCGHCGEHKALTAFNKEKKKKDGLSAWCKACKSKDQSRRRVEILAGDADWQLRRKTFAKLSRLVAKGEIDKPTACPLCEREVPAREMQARFLDAEDPRSVTWRCRACALDIEGKSVVVICKWCEEPFRAQTHQLRRGGGRYCSIRCRNAWMTNTAEHVHTVAARERTRAVDVFVDDRF